MGFGVNWESIHTDTPPQLLRINIARFTQYVVKTKAKELLCGYINAQLEAGAQVEQMDSMLGCIINFIVVGTKTNFTIVSVRLLTALARQLSE